MQPTRVTVVVPTLAADHALWECLDSLRAQTFTDFQAVVVDNSAAGLVRSSRPPRFADVSILEPAANIGFGAAVNLAARQYPAEFVAVLNDDAAAEPEWLSELVQAMEAHPTAGSCASQVRLREAAGRLDSAAMRIAADGSSKQRGHGESPSAYMTDGEALLASGSAALYRKTMLDQTGGFDESFFLYCEDTDLGLRARWAGWTCRYAAGAIVHHRYSHSAGRASKLKAFYVERNRIYTVIKNFPANRLPLALGAAAIRYVHHLTAMLEGRGAAAEFRNQGQSGWQLALCVVRAHWESLSAFPELWQKRRAILRAARIRPAEFRRLLDEHSISLKQVASL